ncbi:PREDICTED: signal-regulatory protein beta-1 isoform 3-like, partial [Thamnophis sirtalis]|uniref:Signal-regulatory protein beta-1 isoform 3-like n=1 Tax=Thamnophis sirtalis TaxID=35019 RepID=A0A6I9Z3V7_9SAUR
MRLFLVSVVTGQNVKITQLPESISVKAGETITLECTVTGDNLPGSVRWFKGRDREQEIYSDKQRASNKVARVIPGSNTDFSIKIQNVRPEDAGTYYCNMFKTVSQGSMQFGGKGTLVSVIAMPVIIGLTGRITAGSRASFNCSAEGFFPREITVIWLKDGEEIPVAQTNIVGFERNETTLYRVDSMVEIPLGQENVSSQMTCQIQHTSLDSPLQQTFTLGGVPR